MYPPTKCVIGNCFPVQGPGEDWRGRTERRMEYGIGVCCERRMRLKLRNRTMANLTPDDRPPGGELSCFAVQMARRGTATVRAVEQFQHVDWLKIPFWSMIQYEQSLLQVP